MAKLTDKRIRALKPKKARYTVWDGNGFGVRISPKGRKSFIWVYHFEGRSRRLTLGTYPALSLANANIMVAEARKALDEVRDPGLERVDANKGERDADSVSKLVDDYIEKYAKVKKRTAAEDERMLRKDVVPAWGRRKVKSIKRRDVNELLDTIVARNASITANRTLAVIRRMFNWGVSRDILEHNPCLGVETPGQEKRRERVLNDKEIKTFWQGLDKAGCTETVRLAFRFLLVTGQRRSEVTQLRWDEIDEKRRDWIIPSGRVKNKAEHVVPLSKFAWSLLKDARRTAPDSAYVFPSIRGGAIFDAPISSPALGFAMRRNAATIGVKDVHTHDLRRTMATEMGSLGVGRFLVGRILNHADPSVTGTYDRYSYYDEKRKALETWGKHLSRILK